VGNALFGENSTNPTLTPLKVSFGGTYGTSTAGSKANLKWEMYNDGITANTFGIGMSLGLMEFQAGSGSGFGFYPNGLTTSAFSISSNGTSTYAGNLIFAPDDTYDIGTLTTNRPRAIYTSRYFYSGTDAGYAIASKAVINSPSDGVIKLNNWAINDFNRLQFGGTTASFPAIKRVGAAIDVVVANDTGFAAVQDLYRRFGANSPEGVVTAPTGAVYHNTSGGAATTFYVKESSPTPSTGWVGK
jgi:hypothetical protein